MSTSNKNEVFVSLASNIPFRNVYKDLLLWGLLLTHLLITKRSEVSDVIVTRRNVRSKSHNQKLSF